MAKSNHRPVDRVERGRRVERNLRLQEIEHQSFQHQARMGWQEENSWDDEDEDDGVDPQTFK